MRRLAVLIVLATLLTSTSVATAEDWPQWLGRNRDGKSSETIPLTVIKNAKDSVLWEKSVGKGFSTVSVAGGRLYTMGNADGSDVVWCLDPATGEDVWQHKYPCKEGSYPGPRMTPTVEGDLVYTLSRLGHLFCLGAADGSVKWSTNIQKDHGVKQTRYSWGLSCSPIVVDDLLIVTAGRALAFDKKSGKLRWESGGADAGFSSPSTINANGVACVASFSKDGLAIVTVADGKEVASLPWETRYGVNTATPIVSGDRVFLSTGYGRGCTLVQLAADGLKQQYEHRKMRNHCHTCILTDGHLYGIDGQQGSNGTLVCLDFASGEVKWEAGGFRVGGGLILADDKLMFMGDGGELIVAEASPKAYKEIARAKVLEGRCWTAPVLSGSKIYCRSHEGRLVCLGAD